MPATDRACAIVPAAGESRRFGSMKLLADVRGEPLLQHTLRSLFDAGVTRVVLVTSPAADFGTVTLAQDLRVTLAVNPDPSRGMFSSVQAGMALAEGHPILVLPADMPFVKPDTVAAVVREATKLERVVVPAHDGQRGHPIALPARLKAALLALSGTSTLKSALVSAGAVPLILDVDDPGVVRDVDLPDDLLR